MFVIARANERAKLGAGAAANLATGLTGYTVYRIFIDRSPDFIALCGMVGVSLLGWFSYLILGLIQPEDEI